MSDRRKLMMFLLGLRFLTPAFVLVACSSLNQIVPTSPGDDWKPRLTTAQIEEVRISFPHFEPELFAPSNISNDFSTFTPENYAPPFFFGKPVPQGNKPTPMGIQVETNGYDLDVHPEFFPASGAYYRRTGEKFEFHLATVELSPRTELENKLGIPNSSSPPVWRYELSRARIDLGELERQVLFIQNTISSIVPEVSRVDPRVCEISIEPSFWYVGPTSANGIWVGGMTYALSGGGKYRIRVMAFNVLNEFQAFDWRQHLQSQTINCLLFAAGKGDLVLAKPPTIEDRLSLIPGGRSNRSEGVLGR